MKKLFEIRIANMKMVSLGLLILYVLKREIGDINIHSILRLLSDIGVR
jgi:hypothetical protein